MDSGSSCGTSSSVSTRLPSSRWPSANSKCDEPTRSEAGMPRSSEPASRSGRCGAGSSRSRRAAS
eukprot:10079353-Alexandrium_andersonii.AAC.1